MRSHLQGVALKLQTVKSHQAMAEAMQSTATAMQKMNKAVNVSTITKMLAEFERENQRTEMMQEGALSNVSIDRSKVNISFVFLQLLTDNLFVFACLLALSLSLSFRLFDLSFIHSFIHSFMQLFPQ